MDGAQLGNDRIAVEVVGLGRPATSALARLLVAAKGGPGAHPLDPVTVVVPSNTAGLSARRLLTTGDPASGLRPVNLANVDFVTPFRLAELLGGPHVGDRRPLTNPVLAAAVRSVLATDPGMFAGVADHQATAAAVVGVYAELSRSTPATRAAIAAATSRGAEVVRVVEAVRARLAGFYDEDDLARVAADHAESGGAVVWYLPGRLSPAMEALVAAVLRAVDPTRSGVVVAVTGKDEVDEPVLETVRRCGIDVVAPTGEHEVVVPVAQRIITASDPDEEVRQVVREVVHLAATGTALDRIAVFRPSPSAYARTLLEQLDAAGIPHNGPGAMRLADTVAGRTLLGAMGLRHGGWGRGAVIALVAEAPVRAEGHLASPRRWDAVSRAAGVVGGLDDWRAKLADRLDDLEVTIVDATAAEEAGALGAAPKRIAAQQEAETARRMAGFIDVLAAWLEAIDHAPTWSAKSEAARSLLHGLLGREQRRVSWPEVELTAAQRVDEALVRLAALDELEPAPGATTFELAVAAELDEPVGRVGRFGSGVLVAPLGASVGTDVDAVFVLGLAEGTCPAQRRDPALLPETDRLLAAAGELPTQDDRLLDQHRAYLAALAAGRSLRVVLYPRGDLRGRRERLASRWLLDSASALAGRRVHSSDLASLAGSVVEVVASYADGVARAVTHGAVAERDVAALLGSPDPGGHPLATSTAAIGRGFAARAARTGAAFTEWDGNLAGHALDSPATGTPLSPSRLETWADCPFRYFLQSVLRLGERDDPERIVEISAAERGTLVHKVLERFLREVLDRPVSQQPAPADPWSAADHARVAEIAEEEFVAVEAKGLTGRPLHWRRTKADVLADLVEFLRRDDAHRAAGGLRPVRVELEFGMGGAEPLTIPLGDGVRSLTFRGKIDRVDAADAGGVVVSDYKTGKGKDYGELADDPVREGRTLQLGIYAEAARAELGVDDVDARYWMISGAGGWARHGYEWTDERRARFLEVTEAIVDGVESGLFPARPGEYDSFFGAHENCGFCPFDRVCPRDREDHERAMAGAPELTLLDRLRLPRSPDTEAPS